VSGFLLVLSSPSGGGKTTIARRLLATRSDLGYSVSATTRPPRPGEEAGKAYYFLSREEFERRIANGEFLEWATYAGELYGTLWSEVDRIVASGRHAVLDIELQGARQLREQYENSVFVFVLPPSVDALVERLTARNTDGPEQLRTRLRQAATEIAAAGEYDYVVVNDNLDRAVAEVNAIIEAEAKRSIRHPELDARLARLSAEVAAAAEAVGRPAGSSTRG